jgi:PAS domain-containing protein
VFDVVPTAVLIVDGKGTVLDANPAARQLFSTSLIRLGDTRTGEALQCVHAVTGVGRCGENVECNRCGIRHALSEAISGETVRRRLEKMRLFRDGKGVDFYFLVTTSPCGQSDGNLAVVTLDDVSDVMILKDLVHICAGCRSIRGESESWERVETYFRRRLGIEFTHDICPQCMKRLYPEFATESE